MGRISEEDKERVREATDIVALFSESIPLKQKGRTFWCCCPFHNEKTASLCVDPNKQFWHCYGCGEGGDVFTFVQKYENIPFPEAVRKLADKAHIELKEDESTESVPRTLKERLKQVCKATAEFYHTQLLKSTSPEATRAREYLSKRNLGNDVAKKWQLGFAPGRSALVNHLSALGFTPEEMVSANVAVASNNNARDRFYDRIMFPIRDEFGDVIAFGGRVIGEGNPKYLNSQETPIFQKSRVLFGLDKAKVAMASKGCAIVTEGYTDVIALHEAGITNTVATLGTALTKPHIRMLARHAKGKIIYLFDGDEAGQRAADRALSLIDATFSSGMGSVNIELMAVTLPDNLDPADYIAQRGTSALQELLDSAKPLIRYGIDRRRAKYDLGKPEGRASFFNDALSILAPIKATAVAQSYALEIAQLARLSESEALHALKTLSYKPYKEQSEPATTPQAIPPKTMTIATAQVPTRGRNLTETNRLNFEKQFLSLIAANPSLGLAHADALAQTHWHSNLFKQIADKMLEIFIANPSISSASLISSLGEYFPGATGMLTESVSKDSTSESLTLEVAFLLEELTIGDLEDDLALMNVSLYEAQNASDEERRGIFSVITEMQQEIARRKRAHQSNTILQGE